MGRLDIPISDHREIRTSASVRAAARAIGEKIADAAASAAGAPNGYGVDEVVGTDRTRVHVWAKTAKAEQAEAKSAPLLQAAMQVHP